MHFVGIDWGMEKHDICVVCPDGQVVSQTSVQHSSAGFQQLQALFETLQPLQIVLERGDGLLVDWLLTQEWPVRFIHPTVLAHRRPRRSKDDRSDAQLLAHLLRTGDPDCRPIPQQSPLVQQLKQAAIAYDQAKADQRRHSNRLMYVLRQYYPAIIEAFPSVFSLTCLDFLEKYPHPEDGRALSMTQIEDFLIQQRYTARTGRLPHIYAALQKPMPRARYPEAYILRLQLLIPVLRAAHYQRASAEKQLGLLFKQHPEAEWWASFPGAGPLTSARLLGFIGDARERFPDAAILQAVAGTAPVTRRSGKQQLVEFRNACSHRLRATVIDLARNSIRQSGWARSYYNEQIARGHSSSRAFRALANRWVAIIWKLWQTNEPYNEALHVANRSRHRQSA